MRRQTARFDIGRRHVLVLVLMAVVVYVLLPQIGDFRSSWHLLSRPRLSFTLLAVVLAFMTFAAGAGTYCLLAFHPLRYGRTVLIQLAATFVNRLLPAGIGALGANYLYLRHERHNAVQAGSMVAINNLLGFLGHGLLLLFTFAMFSSRALTTPDYRGLNPWLIPKLAGLVVLSGGLLFLIFGRQRVRGALGEIGRQLSIYRRRPWRLWAALSTSMTLTLCNVLSLCLCVLALDLHVPFAAVLLIFTFGVSAGAAVPTPGGLGGFEAGLAAGLVAYGVDAAPALAAALLFRLISYWLPLIAGAVAFLVCQRRGLFRA